MKEKLWHDVTLKGLTLVVANFEFGGKWLQAKKCRIPLGAVRARKQISCWANAERK